MCIRDRLDVEQTDVARLKWLVEQLLTFPRHLSQHVGGYVPVSYTHLRAHETVLDLVCRLLLEKKNKK